MTIGQAVNATHASLAPLRRGLFSLMRSCCARAGVWPFVCGLANQGAVAPAWVERLFLVTDPPRRDSLSREGPGRRTQSARGSLRISDFQASNAISSRASASFSKDQAKAHARLARSAPITGVALARNLA